MNCIIIDNKKSADVLKKYICNSPDLQLLAACENIRSAEQLLEEQTPDLIFMDIELPGKSAHDFIKASQGKYNIVITTSEKHYAFEAFELGVTDYLLKPFLFERFLKAVNKVKHHLQPIITLPLETNANYFFVKSDNRFEKIDMKGILYIEGLQNYITIQTETKKVITYSSLKSIESYLSENEFLRIQKSFIVSIAKIDRIDSDDVVIGKTSIPISRAIKGEVLRTILNNRLYKYEC